MFTTNSPLYSASMRGDFELAVNRIEEGDWLDWPNGPNAMTALHIAAARGYVNIVDLLLDSGATADACDSNGFTPFYFACQNGHEDVVKQFSASDVDKVYGDNSETVLHVAVSNQHTRIIRLLLDRKANVNVCTTTAITPLYLASKIGNLEIVRMLVRAGADVDSGNLVGRFNPLLIAAARGYVNIVDLLLDSGATADVCDSDGFTPFYFACQNGHVDVFKQFSTSSVDEVYGANSETVLHVAVSNQHTRIIQLLLDRKANVNVCTTTGSTPLYLASKIGNLEIVRMLVRAGANVKSGNLEEGVTPLHVACECEHVHVVDFLLRQGASFNCKFTCSKAVGAVFKRVLLEREEKELLAIEQKRLQEQQQLIRHQLLQRPFRVFF